MGPSLPLDFRRRFAAWVRLEPRCRTDDFSEGVRAEVADPLWFLARQWQFGEFDAEDAGSPIEVDLAYSTQSVDSVKLGSEDDAHTLGAAPLESVVETELLTMDWRRRAQIGQQAERLASQRLSPSDATALLTAWREAFPYEGPTGEAWDRLDYASRRFVRLMRGRVIDGGQLLDAASRSDLPAVTVAANAANVVGDLLDELTEWITATGSSGAESPSAWRTRQLEYSFELNPPAGSPTPKSHLVAPSYQSGELDWHSVLLEGDSQGNWSSEIPVRTYPTRIPVAGLSARWWSFEDADMDWGDLHVEKTDLAKLLLMEFALIYGDDWFSTPMPVDMGRLVRIDSMTVKNVFGESHVLNSGLEHAERPIDRWEMFTLSPAQTPRAPGAALLFVPRLTGGREESEPLEEVRFLRDEGANLVWAVERRVMDGRGRSIDGFDAHRERRERLRLARIRELEDSATTIEAQLSLRGLSDAQRDALSTELTLVRDELRRLERTDYAPEPAGEGILRFRLATTVPENWIPFIPVDSSAHLGLGHRSIRLQRAEVLRNRESELTEPIQAASRLLDGNPPLLWLDEETVAREGTRLVLTRHRARGTDGKTHVWTGRKVRIGRGEGRSGLRFDVVQNVVDILGA